MNSIENNVCEAIEILAEKIINNADYDKTIQAQIVSCIDQEAGKYKIKYQNSYSYAYATSPEIHYSNGTYVYVQVPNGDMKKNKTILNAVENSKVDYGVAIDLEDEYDKIGVNCISSEQYPFKLSSYHLEKKIIYDSKSDKNDINIDINNFASNIMYADSFLCAATIRTSFKDTQIQGNYGIGFIFDLINPEDENETISKAFELNVNNMQGNPYSYLNDTRQYQIFNIDGTKFKQISQIYIFIENFTTEQKTLQELTNDDYEVFISNLELQATNRMSEDEINGYALRVIAQDGNIFYAGEEDTAQRHFISYLKYRGTVIDPSNIKFYWFRENSKVFSNNEKFNQYGGISWECLNEKTDETIPNWIAANEKFAIKKSSVTAAEMNFKCVAVYKDNQISKEFKLQNLDNEIPKIELSINRNDGTIEKDIVTFENGVGSPTITCTVTKKNEETQEYEEVDSSKYLHRWTREDANGAITNLIYDEEENFNAFVTIYDIQKYWEISDYNINYKNASRKEKALFNRMNSYLSQYEKCSLDFDSMEETISKTNIGKKFNETIQTLKSLGYRTFVSYNIELYEEYIGNEKYIGTFNLLYNNIVEITKNNSDYISSWKDKTGSIYNKTTFSGVLTDIEELSMESIIQDPTTKKYYPEKHKYWNYIKKYYDNFITTCAYFLKTNKEEKDIQKCIDELKENYDKLKIELSQRTLDYYGNKIYNFKVSEIYNFCIIKCAVTEINDDKYIGTTSIKITNVIERNVGTLMLKDGNQLFQYNESGISPADASNINPITLIPLSFSLYTKTGELVSPNIIISNGSIEWKIPAENTLIEIEDKKYDEERIENNIVYHIYKNISSLAYKIKQVYSFSTYNQIELVVTYNNTIYSAKTNFTFLKQGEIGSSGTQYNCRIVPNTNMQNIPQYPILTKVEGESIGYFNFTYTEETRWKIGDNTTSTEGIKDSFPFKVEIYESNQKTYAGYLSGETSDKTINYDIQWEFLSNTYNTKEVDISDFKIEINNDNKKPYLCLNINEKDKELYSFKNKGNNFGAANILKCTITRIKGEEKDIFYATLPIVTVTINKENIKKISTINIKNGTGYQFVQYSSGGLNPQYNDLIPFELEIYNNNDDITENLNYVWNTVGQIYDYIEDDKGNKKGIYLNDTSFNIIQVKDDDHNIVLYKIKAQAYQSYDGLNVTNGISCSITDNEQNEYAFINIPIHCYLNRYAFANLNVWDGNSIQIDEKGGYILTPQIGAGHKEKSESTNTNTFTGLLMGDVKESSWTKKQTGLFGYNQGKRTLFLDSETGGAIFGPKEAQITIGPNTDSRLMIYSSDFWKSTNFNEKGFLNSFKYSYILNETNPKNPVYDWSGDYGNGKGLLIDFNQKAPAIIFGNGSFSVENGILKAKSAKLKGSITFLDEDEQEVGKIEKNSFSLTASPDNSVVGSSASVFHVGRLCIDTQKTAPTNIGATTTSYGLMLFANTDTTPIDYIGLGHYKYNDINGKISNRYYPVVYAKQQLKSQDNGELWLYKGLNFKDVTYFWSDCHFKQICAFEKKCTFSKIIVDEFYLNNEYDKKKTKRIYSYWNGKKYHAYPGAFSIEYEKGKWLHFLDGIFIDCNRNSEFFN